MLNNMLLSNLWVKKEIKKIHEDKNTVVQNLGAAAKAVPRGKFIAI